MVAAVVAVVMMGKCLGRYGRDGEDGDSGKGKHQVAKSHKNQFLSIPEAFVQKSGGFQQITSTMPGAG